MEKRTWTGFKIAVYITLVAYTFYFIRIVYLFLTNPNRSGQPYYFNANPFYLKWGLIFAFFILYELVNVKLIKYYLDQLQHPSTKFIQLHDFVTIMNTALLGFYLYMTYISYRDFLALAKNQAWYPQPLFTVTTILSLIVSVLNFCTIAGSIKLRKYLKRQSLKSEEAMLHSLGSQPGEA